MNASFAASNALFGDIAFLSQSGAFCTAILDMSLEKNLGFSHFLSLGNKVDINENSLVEYWLNDPDVHVIGAYLEEVDNGQKLLEQISVNKNKKPIVVFKPGVTEEAKKAISSHTGAIAGESQVLKTAFEQYGIIEANTVEEMFDYMLGFSWLRLPKSNRVAVITNAGGPGVITTDEIVKAGLSLSNLSESNMKEMRGLLPVTASVSNPIDVIGDALAERYRAPLDSVIHDKNVDALIIILTPQLVTQVNETADLIIEYSHKTDKPILAVFLGGVHVKDAMDKLYLHNIPAFSDTNDAVKVLAALYKYQQFQDRCKKEDQDREKIMKLAGKGRYRSELRKFIKDNEVVVSPEKLIMKIAQEVGLNMVEQKVCSTLKEAQIFARSNYPVVVKASTNAVIHKTDEKAVYLNVQDKFMLEKAFRSIYKLSNKYVKNAPIEVVVQKQIKNGEELFIGVKRDGGSNVYIGDSPGFGHLLTFGMGGIYTEVYRDLQFVLAPVTKDEIERKLMMTKVSQIIEGARGQKKLAKNEYIKTIAKVQKMAVLYPEVVSMDINPVILTRKKAVIVDLKLFISDH